MKAQFIYSNAVYANYSMLENVGLFNNRLNNQRKDGKSQAPILVSKHFSKGNIWVLKLKALYPDGLDLELNSIYMKLLSSAPPQYI